MARIAIVQRSPCRGTLYNTVVPIGPDGRPQFPITEA